MTANYLRFLAFLVSGSYTPVVLMNRVLRLPKLEGILNIMAFFTTKTTQAHTDSNSIGMCTSSPWTDVAHGQN
jgi:hypothetical protein